MVWHGSACPHQVGAVGQGLPQLFGWSGELAPNVAGRHKARPCAGAQLACTMGVAQGALGPGCVCGHNGQDVMQVS